MSARLDHKVTKDTNVTELFIDTEDGKTCLCVMRFDLENSRLLYLHQLHETELSNSLEILTKAINCKAIEIIRDGL